MRIARLFTYEFAKRSADVVLAGLVLLAGLPLIAVVVLLVAANLGRPVIFAQERPGLGGKLFTLYKFRSMRSVDVERGFVTNEQRLTKFGHFLRSTSLDELPSLWNILRGDMSLVGPRPLRVSYLDRYSSEQQRRHAVRPGLTGLAQVRGRNALGWDDRLELDTAYVRTRSPALDARILIETVRAVVRREGIAEDGQATKSEFFGPQRTSRLELKDLAREHLAERVEWLNDPGVRSGISISFVADLTSMEGWFERVSKGTDRLDWVGVDRDDESLASMCGIQRVKSNTFSLYLYVDPERRGQGFGGDTMELLIARARALGASLLTLETPSENIAAIRLYSRLGFRDFGPIEDGAKRGMQLDVGVGHKDG